MAFDPFYLILFPLKLSDSNERLWYRPSPIIAAPSSLIAHYDKLRKARVELCLRNSVNSEVGDEKLFS